jgi:hypothetical protein
MSDIKNGGRAFPETWHPTFGYSPDQCGQGMSLRDYFAAQALQGMYACGGHRDVFSGVKAEPRAFCMTDSEVGACAETLVARMAYAVADAMLKAREQEDGE